MSGRHPRATTEQRALMTGGTSSGAIYKAVAGAVRDHHPGGGVLVDVGCGSGAFHSHVRDLCDRYIGADVIRHEGFPDGVAFRSVDLDVGRVDLPDRSADVIVCIETIGSCLTITEHRTLERGSA